LFFEVVKKMHYLNLYISGLVSEHCEINERDPGK